MVSHDNRLADHRELAADSDKFSTQGTLQEVPHGDAILELVRIAAAHAAAGQTDAALACCNTIEQQLDDSAESRVAELAARAIVTRVLGEGPAGNLYDLHQSDAQSMLTAFNVLARETPLITFGHRTANALLLPHLSQASHLIELGIGSGVQLAELIRALPKWNVRKLKVTAVDLPQVSEAESEAVSQRLQTAATEVGIELKLVQVAQRAEEFEPAQWIVEGESVGVNAALMMHHLQEMDRDCLLERIRAINPEIFTLVEPDVEHHSLDFCERVDACLVHYVAVFRSLSSLIAELPDQRATIERHFFGREILNIIACEGKGRFERHETRDQWRDRLLSCGFSLSEARADSKALDLKPGFSVKQDQCGSTLTWEGTPLVCCSAWTPHTIRPSFFRRI